MDLGLQVSDRDGWTVLVVHGELDIATAPGLRERLHALLADGRNQLVVDLDDLRLAVTEALANAIDAEWRKPTGERAPVVVRCDLEPGRIAVEIHDEAGGFDPDAVPTHPEVTKPARLKYERGLGIPLMREL